ALLSDYELQTRLCAQCCLKLQRESSHVADQLFFFQAEDGIRDATVTGVQTCALPISICPAAAVGQTFMSVSQCYRVFKDRQECRSEERRVGKECRFRLASCHADK